MQKKKQEVLNIQNSIYNVFENYNNNISTNYVLLLYVIQNTLDIKVQLCFFFFNEKDFHLSSIFLFLGNFFPPNDYLYFFPIKLRIGNVLGNIIPNILNNADVADNILVIKSLNVYGIYSSICSISILRLSSIFVTYTVNLKKNYINICLHQQILIFFLIEGQSYKPRMYLTKIYTYCA